jgi:hypothetical protein
MASGSWRIYRKRPLAGRVGILARLVRWVFPDPGAVTERGSGMWRPGELTEAAALLVRRRVSVRRQVSGEFRGHFLLPLPAGSVTLAECPT